MLRLVAFTNLRVITFVLVAALGALAQSARTEPVKVGDIAPDFTLSNNSGKQITLSETIKTGPIVLVFYRGSWCPFCSRQLADLRGMIKDGEQTMLFAISIDGPETSNNLIKKIEKDGKGKINFGFLSDTNAKTIDAYGLRDPRYKNEAVNGIPYPTVYVIDANRKVAWAKLEKDYKNRPTNSEIRAAIDDLK